MRWAHRRQASGSVWTKTSKTPFASAVQNRRTDPSHFQLPEPTRADYRARFPSGKVQSGCRPAPPVSWTEVSAHEAALPVGRKGVLVSTG